MELWRFLTEVLVPDHDGDRSTMSQTTYDPKSVSYIEFKGAKNPHVLDVLGWSWGGLWRFLTGILDPDHDGDRTTKSQTTYVSKFSLLI